ncbi:MAG: cell division protein FtsL [Halorhodospira halophila]|uniref:cell division protein FtsL n=1 Tax=Halorhodospira TaxID=85108 RepID=UPI001912AADA|nr:MULTISPECIES: cell division protein FtsL [Halorhodospira]MBK5935667.1 cell division protein FtsL [Halorhodospira halophila]MBK5944411.1 cell division protein FtsL [Halorhodospira halophila]MCC3750538.1 cell division protein FtsL [Halorhodospira halophila]MCG5527468.1 cell division protein FtsL [Halorhodospira halophila]MCG5533650.1 cell division protein FtsL [Halorhodospira sp. 9621]
MSRAVWGMTVLVPAVVASAIGVVAVQHEYRGVFVTLQDELERSDRLREEWSMLQLEQGAWAGHSRLERVAGEELGMALPERDEIIILRRP